MQKLVERQVHSVMALRKEDMYYNDDQEARTTKRSRITIDVSPELRRRIKLAAAQNDLSISEYLGRILDEAVPEEEIVTQQKHPATQKMLEELMQVRDEILRERNGQPFEDSTEMIRQMRDERSKYLGEL
jgi:DNA polymerase elongation subunit (family B)